jgi:hypothetical protein
MVPSEDGSYKVVKILAIDQSAVHVRLYAERFSRPPRLVAPTALTLGTIHDEHHGIGHLPLSRPTFASWLPVRIQHEEVTEDELDGFRIWERSKRWNLGLNQPIWYALGVLACFRLGH